MPPPASCVDALYRPRPGRRGDILRVLHKSKRIDCSAGTRPNSNPATSATAALNARMRRSGVGSQTSSGDERTGKEAEQRAHHGLGQEEARYSDPAASSKLSTSN